MLPAGPRLTQVAAHMQVAFGGFLLGWITWLGPPLSSAYSWGGVSSVPSPPPLVL